MLRQQIHKPTDDVLFEKSPGSGTRTSTSTGVRKKDEENMRKTDVVCLFVFSVLFVWTGTGQKTSRGRSST